MEKIDIKGLMDERYKNFTNKKTLGLEKSLDFYCVYRYLNDRDDMHSEFIDDVFHWAHTDYNVNKFLATLDIDHNINSKPAIQMTPTNVYDFLDAIETQYPKHVTKRAMEARAKSLKFAYDSWVNEHSSQTKLSLAKLASKLTEFGVKHVYVKASPDFVLDDLDQAIFGMKAEVTKLVKAKDGAVSGRYRNTISKTAEYIKTACYALSRSEYSEDDLPKLQAYSKSFNTMAQALFSQPSLAQLSDHKNGRYYTKMSTFRASSRQDAKRIADAETMMEAFMFITDAAMNLVVRDTELLSMSQDLTCNATRN